MRAVCLFSETWFPKRRAQFLADLLLTLVLRDMKLRYKRSVLGILWGLLNPLAQLVVFAFVFRFVLPVEVPNYTTFLFTGVLVWSWFQASLYQATSAVVDNRDLIKQPGFPVAILPTVTVTSHLIHFLLALPVLFFFIMFGGLPLTGALLALPVVILIQFMLTLALAYPLATFHVLFRDTQYLLGVLLSLLFFLTPVFYDARSIPEGYQFVYHLNPMVHLLNAYRSIFLAGTTPDRPTMILLILATFVLFSGSYAMFARMKYRFVDEL